MNHLRSSSSLSVIGIFLIFGISCTISNKPKLSTRSISSVSENAAVANCKILSEGHGSFLERGVCWSSSNQTPTLADEQSKTISNEAEYTADLSDLQPNTTYYVRAFATNDAGTGYGQVMQLTTKKGWALQTSGITSRLEAVCFVDANTGWAAGGNEILHTTNGGITWTSQNTGLGSAFLRDIHFVDESNGYAVGWDGIILKTTNSGNNWTNLNFGSTIFFEAVHFTDENTGYAIGERYIFKTTNGGNSWSMKFNGSSILDLVDVQFFNANKGYFLDSNGDLVTTDDGFATYNATYGFNTPGYNDAAFYFTSPSTGYMVGRESGNGSAGKTTDRGQNWYDMSVGTTSPIFEDVQFDNENMGFIVGGNGFILKTFDAGKKWTTSNSGTNSFLYAVACPDENIAYAVGDSGTILKYE